MLRIDMLTVAGVNIEEEASELFAPGLLLPPYPICRTEKQSV